MPTRNHIPLAGDGAFERFCRGDHDFAPASRGHAQFSARERELLDTVARGMDNLQIAAQLGLAEKTVRNLLSRLYGKLALEGRPQAIVWAREHGYGQR
jgi:DNA-binding CsgD family transcriptional regulator